MNEYLSFLDFQVMAIAGHSVTIGQLLLVPLLLICGVLFAHWLAKMVANRLIARQVDADIVHLVRRLFYIVVIVILTITTLDFINVPITAFAFISGAVAIGIGFGAQNIINNFISGWILMWERPIRIGDFLEVGEAKGTVEAINTRSTRVRRVDGVHMLIPNSYLLENTVVNWTLVDRLTRTSVRVGVAYGSPTAQVSTLFMQAICEQKEVLSDPKPVVIFEDFADNAMIFDAFIWVEASVDRDLKVIRSNIRFRLDALFHEHEIVVAFPQRDIHIDGSLILRQSTGDIGDPNDGR
jgi:small-conductance mechanosensitive channel